MFPQKMVARIESNGQNLTIPCAFCTERYRAGDPEAVLYTADGQTRIGFICDDCFASVERPTVLAQRVRERAFDALADELETAEISAQWCDVSPDLMS